MMEPQITTITIPGLKLNVRIWGPETGIPVLGLHGWLDNAATFDLIAPLLPELRLVAVDFPGHGFSDHLPLCATYNNIDRALQMLQVVDALNWSEFSIIGHSLGGVVGQLMAAIAPERVKKIALIDIIGLISYPSHKVLSQIQLYEQAMRHPVRHAIYPSMDDAAKKRVVGSSSGPISIKAARVLVEGGMRKTAEGYMWTSDPKLQLPSAITMTNEQANVIVENMRSLCLIIAGNDGILYNRGVSDHPLLHAPNVRLCQLQGAHHLHLDTPEPVAQLLADFLQASSVVINHQLG